MAIPFHTDQALRDALLQNVGASGLSADDLTYLQAAVREPDVTIRSLNAADLSDGDRAMLATLMLLDARPSHAAQARMAQNTGVFLEGLLNETDDVRAVLREADFGQNPFYGSPAVFDVTADGFTLETRTGVAIRRDDAGAIDVSEAQDWNPEALEATLHAIDNAMRHGDDPLTTRLRGITDQAIGTILSDAHAALSSILEAKQARVEAGRVLLDEPGRLDVTRPPGEMNPADIDAFGLALQQMSDLESPAEPHDAPYNARDVFMRLENDPELVEQNATTLSAALAALGPEGKLDRVVFDQVGAPGTVVAALMILRAIEEGLDQPELRDHFLAAGSAPALVNRLVEHYALHLVEASLERQLEALQDEDPYGLFVGHDDGLDPRAITAIEAHPSDGPVASYVFETQWAQHEISAEGLKRPDDDSPIPFASLSPRSLRNLANILAAASPSEDGGLGYLRARDEIERGGVSMRSLLDEVRGALTDKLTAAVEARSKLAEALAPLAKIEARE
ncbi:MAG: hypothetical protein RIT81_31020 [Deltaproteobacteria bacterium]